MDYLGLPAPVAVHRRRFHHSRRFQVPLEEEERSICQDSSDSLQSSLVELVVDYFRPSWLRSPLRLIVDLLRYVAANAVEPGLYNLLEYSSLL